MSYLDEGITVDTITLYAVDKNVTNSILFSLFGFANLCV